MKLSDFDRYGDVADLEDKLREWKEKQVDGTYQFSLMGFTGWNAVVRFNFNEDLLSITETSTYDAALRKAEKCNRMNYDATAVLSYLETR